MVGGIVTYYCVPALPDYCCCCSAVVIVLSCECRDCGSHDIVLVFWGGRDRHICCDCGSLNIHCEQEVKEYYYD